MIRTTDSAICLHRLTTTTTTMASSSQTNPAYSVPSFNAWDRLLHIHQEVTDFLHYQSHIRFAATTSIPPGTRPAVEQEREAILEFLREERRQIRLLKSLLDMVDSNDHELILRYEDSPVTRDEDWGAFAWGPLPQWEEQPPPPQEPQE
jgi:hypothetical protein